MKATLKWLIPEDSVAAHFLDIPRLKFNKH